MLWGFRIVRLKRDSPATGGDGVIEFALVPEGIAEIVKSFRVVGIEGDGVLVFSDGVVKEARGAVGFSEVGVEVRGVWRVGDGGLDELDGILVVTGLVGDDTEEVEGVRVVGVGGEDLAVEGFSVLESAGLVMEESGLECLMDGHVEREHQFDQMRRKEASTLRAKRGASMRGEASMRWRREERRRVRRGRSFCEVRCDLNVLIRGLRDQLREAQIH